MAETVFLRRLSRWQAEQQRETFADLSVEAYRGVSGEAFRDRQDFLRRFAADVQRPAFDMVIGSAAGVVVACAYGYRADREAASDASPPDRTRRPGDADTHRAQLEELTASGQVFTVAELMVLPAHRTRGVATGMLERLFARTDSAVAAARVARANSGASAAFRAWGWSDMGQGPGAVADGDTAVRQVWSRRLRR